MRNRLRRPLSSPIERLRMAIDCLPVATRQAMLAGVRTGERIIAGAYVDGHGGVCPMLAAHRRGGRTDLLAFARSWDRFTRASGAPRVASERERRILLAQLEASLESADPVSLDVAIAEHRALVAEHRALQRSSRPRAPQRELDDADPKGRIIARRSCRSRAAPEQASEARGRRRGART